jgi:hypothetical protein
MSRVHWKFVEFAGTCGCGGIRCAVLARQLLAAPVVTPLPPPKLPPGAAEDPRMGV